MATNLGYTRKFIILKKDYSNIPGLNPKGHGKLEIKGLRGSIFINVDNGEGNSSYSLLLINGNNAYEIGKIYTEENGRGKGEFAFNLKDLEAMGYSVNKINGILIARGSQILLGGYINKEDNSLERYIKLITKVQMTQPEEPIEEVADIEPAQEEVYEEIREEASAQKLIEEETHAQELVVEEIIEEVTPHELVEEELVEEESVSTEAYVEETEVMWDEEIVIPQDQELEEPILEDTDQVTVFAEEEIEEPFVWELFEPSVEEPEVEDSENEVYIPLDSPYEDQQMEVEEFVEQTLGALEEDNDSVEVEYSNLDYKRRLNQMNQTTNYVLNILRFFPYVEPFKYNMGGYNWWRIDIEDSNEQRGFLPYFSYVTGGNQKYPIIENAVTANELMRKHQHYLFGMYNVNDVTKFYVYGIPGKFTKENHPQRGQTGFNTWFESNDDDGYWILFIDPLTGKVIHPINPMVPID